VQHERAAADAGRLGLDQVEHELDRDRGVGGRAAGLQDLQPGLARGRVGAHHHHPLGPDDRPLADPARPLGRLVLRARCHGPG
jgi:hypothetical protein